MGPNMPLEKRIAVIMIRRWLHHPTTSSGTSTPRVATTTTDSTTTRRNLRVVSVDTAFYRENALVQKNCLQEVIQQKYRDRMEHIQLHRINGTKLKASSPLSIAYEDDHFVIVNKPSGVLTVPPKQDNSQELSRECFSSLAERVHYEYCNSYDACTVTMVQHRIVHRLDMHTSGLVIFGKSLETTRQLQALFRNRQVHKEYEAIVVGNFSPEDASGSSNFDDRNTILLDLPLARCHVFPPYMRVATPWSELEARKVVEALQMSPDYRHIKFQPAKSSQTICEVLRVLYQTGAEADTFPLTHLRLTPLTGRRHQLRVHLAACGYPILGDPAYCNHGISEPRTSQYPASGPLHLECKLMDSVEEASHTINTTNWTCAINGELPKLYRNWPEMCLHATKLEFEHPVMKDKVSVVSPMPYGQPYNNERVANDPNT